MNANELHKWVCEMMENNEESKDCLGLTSTNLDLNM